MEAIKRKETSEYVLEKANELVIITFYEAYNIGNSESCKLFKNTKKIARHSHIYKNF